MALLLTNEIFRKKNMKKCQNGFSFDLYNYKPAKVVDYEGNSNFSTLSCLFTCILSTHG